MTTPQQVVKQLQDACVDITKDPIDNLISSADWGRINFQSARPTLETVYAIANLLRNLPLELIPEQDFSPLMAAVGSVATEIQNIRKFSIEQANATQTRDQIVQRLQNNANNLYAQSQARLPFLALQRGDVRRNEEAFAKAVKDAQEMLTTANEYAVQKRIEVDQVITAAREASASVGVATFTGDFNTTATALETSADRWLLWATILGIATIAVSLLFPFVFTIEGMLPAHASVTDATFTLRAAQLISSKLVTIGALFTATIWCGRMYKATKHQAAVNRHRANALKTFQAFVKASSDDPTRNAVLLETTRSIFALASTGYLDAADTSDGATKILEIVKSVTETKH